MNERLPRTRLPPRHWATLPEAKEIVPLVRDACARTEVGRGDDNPWRDSGGDWHRHGQRRWFAAWEDPTGSPCRTDGQQLAGQGRAADHRPARVAECPLPRMATTNRHSDPVVGRCRERAVREENSPCRWTATRRPPRRTCAGSRRSWRWPMGKAFFSAQTSTPRNPCNRSEE